MDMSELEFELKENIAELIAYTKKLEHELKLSQEKRVPHVTIEGEDSDIAKDLRKYIIENHLLTEALEDFANNGTRHDLNPTMRMDGRDHRRLIKYIENMDSNVRKRARKALKKQEKLWRN